MKKTVTANHSDEITLKLFAILPLFCPGNEELSTTYGAISCAPSQWETALFCNDVSHWLGAHLESALWDHMLESRLQIVSSVWLLLQI